MQYVCMYDIVCRCSSNIHTDQQQTNSLSGKHNTHTNERIKLKWHGDIRGAHRTSTKTTQDAIQRAHVHVEMR